MIPQFPDMAPITAADQDEIQTITKPYLPYSDFNFISLFSWDVEGSTRVSRHGATLIVRFADYVTSAPFYMFIGAGDLNDIAYRLLLKSERDGFGQQLRLIPECMSKALDPDKFRIDLSEDHSDYIVDVASLAMCGGRKWHRHRNFIHRFERDNPAVEFALLNIEEPPVRRQLFRLFREWREKKEEDGFEEEDHERIALERCVETFASSLIVGGIYVRDKLVAFALMEQVSETYAVHHFEKADRWAFCGIIQFLQWQMAVVLNNRGVRYLNIEQDLGIPGLRKGKSMLHPVAYLRKYEITTSTSV